LHDLVNEALALEDAVVSVVGVDDNAHMKRRAFKGIEGINRVSGVQGNLELNMDIARRSVNEDGGAAVSILVWLTASCVEKASSNSGFQLVAEDTVARLELAFFESSEVVFALDGGGGVIGQSSLLSKLAGRAFGMLSELSAKQAHEYLV